MDVLSLAERIGGGYSWGLLMYEPAGDDVEIMCRDKLKKAKVDHNSHLSPSPRANDSPFMTKQLRKLIMNRSRCKNSYYKYKTVENWEKYGILRNACVKATKSQKQNISQILIRKRLMIINDFINMAKNLEIPEFRIAP